MASLMAWLPETIVKGKGARNSPELCRLSLN